jgi:translocation and assembly module TamA
VQNQFVLKVQEKHRHATNTILISTHDLFLRTTGFAILLSGCLLQLVAETQHFEIRIEGVKEKSLRKKVDGVVQNIKEDAERFQARSIRQFAERNIPRIKKLLRSEGFIACDVRLSTGQRNELVLRLNTGPVFQFRKLELTYEGPEPELERPVLLTEIRSGTPALSIAVIRGETRILMALQEAGYPTPEIMKTNVTADHATKTVDVEYVIRSGPAARFGRIEITGLTTLHPHVIHRQIPWYEGQRFNIRQFETLRMELLSTALFSMVSILPAPELDAGGNLPIKIKVSERKHRTVRLGASYKTDEKLGTKLSWEHRNLRGLGERLRLSAHASGFGEGTSAKYRIPGFMRDDQALLLGLNAARDKPDAFESKNLAISVALERKLRRRVTLVSGIAYRAKEVEQLNQLDSFGLFLLPIRLIWDQSDDILNPSTGFQIDFSITPFYDTFSNSITFLKTQSGLRHYLPLSASKNHMLASRLRIGILQGASRNAVPADERYYAGGGGSVRGYEFQSLGPSQSNVPLGGRSVLETAVEWRTRFSKQFGAVLFMDAGAAFESEIPSLDEDFRFGAGAGLRYFTGIGPLRFDIGFPVNRRASDDAFQVYVSLGQSF